MLNARKIEPDNPTSFECRNAIWTSQASVCVGIKVNAQFFVSCPSMASGEAERNSDFAAPH